MRRGVAGGLDAWCVMGHVAGIPSASYCPRFPGFQVPYIRHDHQITLDYLSYPLNKYCTSELSSTPRELHPTPHGI